MESVDQELQQLKENYARMTEGELAAIAEDASDLTAVAREALQAVIAERGLDIQLKMGSPAQPRPDEELVILGWPRSPESAGHKMEILAAAGIPSFLSLEVLEGDVKRARAALAHAEEEEFKEGAEKAFAVFCPKCRSAEVVLEGRDSEPGVPPFKARFHWSCDACGHQWKDEGIEQEVPAGQGLREEEDSGKEQD